MNSSKGVVRVLLAVALLCAACAAKEPTQPTVDRADTKATDNSVQAYHLQAGDSIQISVYGHADLQQSIHIPPDGVIVFPLIGELALMNRTIVDVREELSVRLAKDYLVDPKVTVRLDKVQQRSQIFVLGEVKQPGSIVFQSNLTAYRAISMAGGFTKKANRSRFEITRTDTQGTQRRIEADRETPLKIGDIVVVPVSIW